MQVWGIKSVQWSLLIKAGSRESNRKYFLKEVTPEFDFQRNSRCKGTEAWDTMLLVEK